MASTTGGNEVVKMKLRARLTSRSFSFAVPATYAPKAPRALPRVPICTSTRSPSPSSATTPAPSGPRTPVAWASSTITMAPWRSASATISPSGAMSPSMLKMDSVAMSLRAVAGAFSSRLARWSMSQWR